MQAIVVLAVGLWTHNAFAQTSLEVNVSPRTISLSQTVSVNVQVSIQGQTQSQVTLEAPDLADWDVVGQSRRTNVGFGSGGSQRVTILDLTLRPTRAGELTVGSFSLNGADKPYRSRPVKVTVTGASNPTKRSQSDDDSSASQAPDEYAFLTWEVDRNRVWLGEPIQAKLYLNYRQGLRVNRLEPGKIDLSGFWNEEAKGDTGRARREQIGDLVFIKDAIAQYTLYPMRSGTLELPSIEAEIELSSGGLFRRGRAQAVNRSAPSIPIEVKALPTSGRPKAYGGIVVGQVKLQGRIDRRRVKMNEGVELSVELRIDGLIANVPELELPESDAYRIFPSPTKTQSIQRGQRKINIRRQTWLIRPNQVGKLKIPSLRVDYFDPARGKYRVAQTRQYTVTVVGQKGAKAKTDGLKATPKKGLQLNSIVDQIDVDSVSSQRYTPLWFSAVLFGTPMLFLCVVGINVFRHRRSATAHLRASKTAAQHARRQLLSVGQTGELTDGYKAAHEIIVEYLATRLAINAKGKTYDQVAAALVKAGVTSTVARQMTEQIESIEFARFARAGDASDLKRTAEQASELIGHVERCLV